MLPLVLSSDSHVFEPPDLWQTRIDRAFRDRAPRIERINGGDHVVVEADQILSGIGLISNAGARFEAPETISPQGRFEDVLSGGYDPEQHLKDMALDGVAGEVLYPSQGLFYFKIADSGLMSAIFRAYNDWLHETYMKRSPRCKGMGLIPLQEPSAAVEELRRIVKELGMCGAMLPSTGIQANLGDPRYWPIYEDADRLGCALGVEPPRHLIPYLDGEVCYRLGMVGSGNRDPARGHVGITDRLDLLQAVPPGQLVEHREEVVEGPHHLFGSDPRAAPGEVDHVGEHHRRLGKGVGDHFVVVLEALGDRGG